MKKPLNILFAFADDWGRYASCYQKLHGENSLSSVMQTPHIDRIANEGVLFANAHVPAPSCTPCRSSVISGRYFWQTRLGAILSGAVFDQSIPTFPKILEENGYHVGFTYKVWGPGVALNDPYAGEGNKYVDKGVAFNQFSFHATENVEKGFSIEEAKSPLYNEVRENFQDFITNREEGKPFFYWWGPTTTHRKWKRGSGKKLWGIEPDELRGKLPEFLPDVHEVREDVADYLGECMAVDRGLGVLIAELEKMGELDHTLIVVSGDHGIPGFPRAKCNLYDIGSEVSLMIRLPNTIPGGRVIEDMTNIMDLAPTFLDMVQCEIPQSMTAKSLKKTLVSEKEGRTKSDDDYVITGRERHVAHARQWNLPYPSRAIRTAEYTYIRNFEPNRWPAGDPHGLDDVHKPAPPYEELAENGYAAYYDMDASPTKAWMIHHRGEEKYNKSFQLGFGKRPTEELYHNNRDPHQMKNLAADEAYQTIKGELSRTLLHELEAQQDPRVVEEDCRFEHSPYTDLKLNNSAYTETIELSKLRWEQS